MLFSKLRTTSLTALFLIISYLASGQVTVTGKVTSEDDSRGLPGVNVVIKGTFIGAATDLDGNYRINARSSEDILVFSYTGFLPAEIRIGSQAGIDIILKQDVQALEEIVVLGYSEKKRTEISSAVSVVTEEQLRDVVSPGIGAMLQGKVTGVQVVNSSGSPGAGAEIRIRGTSTLNGNSQPLYVIDGVVAGNSDPGIDPSMIESLTILKDAGATGLYGSRANGGVIVITTKKGRGQPTFNFSATLGYRMPDFGKVEMMDGESLWEAHKGLFIDSTGYFDKIRFNNNYPKELATRNFDWVNEVFQPSFVQNYFLSASGGKDKYSYFIGASYFDEDGTFMGTDFQRLNLRSNNTYRFSERVTFTGNIDLNVSTGKTYDYMDMYYTYLTLPWDSAYDADGNPKYVDQTTGGWYSRDKINPIHSIQNSDYRYKSAGANVQLGLDITILPWLSFSSNNGLSYWTSLATNYVSPEIAGPMHGIGSIYRQNDYGYGAISTDLFKLVGSFGDHNLSGLIGGEFSGGYSDYWGGSAEGLLQGYTTFNTASKNYQVFGAYSQSNIMSFISQVNYDFRQKYFLTASYRLDANSKFAPDNKTASFPTISASWLLNKEGFMKDLKTVDHLKLRVSYGYTGNEAIDPGKYYALYSLTSSYNSQIGAIPFQLPNYSLTWEKTRQLDLGIEAGLWQRLNILIDLYQNKTEDLLYVAQQAYSIGYEFRWENAGSVYNTGVELGLGGTAMKREHFEWVVDFNISYNMNEVADVDNAKPRNINGIEQRFESGSPLYAFYLPVWLGVDPDNGRPMWEKVVRDENGNVVERVATYDYGQAEAQYAGSAMPKYYGGLTSAWTYKGVTLSVNFAFLGGNKVFNRDRSQFDTDGAEPLMNWIEPMDDWNRWEEPGDDATHPRMGANSLSYYPSTRFLEDGDYIKFRNIMLTYQLPDKWFNDKIGGLSVSLSGDNLYTFTEYSGIDPEATLQITDWSLAGVNDLKYPLNRQFNLMVKLSF